MDRGDKWLSPLRGVTVHIADCPRKTDLVIETHFPDWTSSTPVYTQVQNQHKLSINKAHFISIINTWQKHKEMLRRLKTGSDAHKTAPNMHLLPPYVHDGVKGCALMESSQK